MKNTMMLYIRMGLVILVNLYLVRLTLQQLGVEDYGIYNVVAGVVAFCSIFGATMSSATQRFFSFALGKGDDELLVRTYNANIMVYAVIALAAVLILETIGLWFVSERLKVPTGRLSEVLQLYQLCVLSLVGVVISAPYVAILVAHEDMGWYAGISIFEVLLKLGGVLALSLRPAPRLIGYGVVVFITSAVVAAFYAVTCRAKYGECRLRLWKADRKIIGEVVSFTSWTLFGSLSSIVRTHGMTVLLNQFFLPITVTAQVVAVKIAATIGLFAGNFNLGLYPSLVKRYAANDKEGVCQMVHLGTKTAFFLMWVVTLPLLMKMDLIIGLWLKDVPPQTVMFSRLAIVEILIICTGYPLSTAARAHGRVRTYELTLGLLQIFLLLICWGVLRCGGCACDVFLVAITVSVLRFFVQIRLVGRLVDLPFFEFVMVALLPILAVVVLSVAAAVVLASIVSATLAGGLVVCGGSMLTAVVATVLVGLKREERRQLCRFLNFGMKRDCARRVG